MAIRIVGIILLFATIASGQDQLWIKREQDAIRRDIRSYLLDSAEFDLACRTGLKQSISRVTEWVKDSLTATLAASEPALQMQHLVEQSLPIYKDALRGDWAKYQARAGEIIVQTLGLASPVDPTIIQQAFDLREVIPLKHLERSLHARAVIILERQARIDLARKNLQTATPKVVPPPPPPVPNVEGDFTELDRAVAALKEEDERHLEDYVLQEQGQASPRKTYDPECVRNVDSIIGEDKPMDCSKCNLGTPCWWIGQAKCEDLNAQNANTRTKQLDACQQRRDKQRKR